ILLTVFVVSFAWLAFILFGSSTAATTTATAAATTTATTATNPSSFSSSSSSPSPSVFSSLPASLRAMFILLTTANNPNVWLPELNASRLSFLFFASYLALGLFWMNLVLSVIYSSYSSQMAVWERKQVTAREACLREAFTLLDDRRQGWVPARTITQLLLAMEPFKSHPRGASHISALFLRLDTRGDLRIWADEFQGLCEALGQQAREMAGRGVEERGGKRVSAVASAPNFRALACGGECGRGSQRNFQHPGSSSSVTSSAAAAAAASAAPHPSLDALPACASHHIASAAPTCPLPPLFQAYGLQEVESVADGFDECHRHYEQHWLCGRHKPCWHYGTRNHGDHHGRYYEHENANPRGYQQLVSPPFTPPSPQSPSRTVQLPQAQQTFLQSASLRSPFRSRSFSSAAQPLSSSTSLLQALLPSHPRPMPLALIPSPPSPSSPSQALSSTPPSPAPPSPAPPSPPAAAAAAAAAAAVASRASHGAVFHQGLLQQQRWSSRAEKLGLVVTLLLVAEANMCLTGINPALLVPVQVLAAVAWIIPSAAEWKHGWDGWEGWHPLRLLLLAPPPAETSLPWPRVTPCESTQKAPPPGFPGCVPLKHLDQAGFRTPLTLYPGCKPLCSSAASPSFHSPTTSLASTSSSPPSPPSSPPSSPSSPSFSQPSPSSLSPVPTSSGASYPRTTRSYNAQSTSIPASCHSISTTFPASMAVSFNLCIVNNWYVIMDGVAAVLPPGQQWRATVFFASFYVVIVVFVLNVVVAFILEAFVKELRQQKQQQLQQQQ
ncbi:hypothetical protein CLOP_g18159, partial [Closterium sp. NIES-67]